MEKAMAAFPGDALRLTAAQLQAVAAVAGGYLLLGPGQVPGAAQVLEWLQTPPLLVRKSERGRGGERVATLSGAGRREGERARAPRASEPSCSLARACSRSLARSGILSHAPNC
jgi:hypothetical protein